MTGPSSTDQAAGEPVTGIPPDFVQWFEREWASYLDKAFTDRVQAMAWALKTWRYLSAAPATRSAPVTDKNKWVAIVRVTNKGYAMELSKYIAYALPEGSHELYAAPSPAASVLTDEQRASVELALKAMNAAMSVYDVVMLDKARAGLGARLAASTSGEPT